MQSGKDASLAPLERLTHSVEQLEAAEAGGKSGLTGEDLRKTLDQATSEMKAFLDAHPDNVDAIILSVRLARFQEPQEQVVAGGQQAGNQLEQAAKESRARADALASRLDHALTLEPGRAD